MYRLILSVGVCFYSLCTKGQEALNFQEVESSTYRFFMEKKWDSLILTGRQALLQQIDYHYLRVRMGIAYFEQAKYRSAIPHLQMALKFNSFNETAKEYLYLSLLNSEQYEAAGRIAYRFSDSTAAKMKTNHHALVDLIGAEVGEKFCSDTVTGNARFANVVLSHRIEKAISFTHVFSNYYQPGLINKIYQWEYYIGSNIPVLEGWLISPAVHFIFLNTKSRVVIPYIDTSIKVPFLDTTINFSATQTITSFAVKKSFSFFDVTFSGSWNNLYGASHTQETFGMNYYPLGNNRLIAGGSLFLNQDSLKTDTRFSYSASVFYHALKRLRLSAAYYKGNSKFVNEYNGFLVNNSIDLTTSKITFSPTITVSDYISVYGLVQYEAKKRKNFTTPDTDFHYITALAGIKIIF